MGKEDGQRKRSRLWLAAAAAAWIAALACAFYVNQQLQSAREQLARRERELLPTERELMLRVEAATARRDLSELRGRVEQLTAQSRALAEKLDLAQAAGAPRQDVVNQLNVEKQKISRLLAESQSAADGLRQELQQMTSNFKGQVTRFEAERNELQGRVNSLNAALTKESAAAGKLAKDVKDIEQSLASARRQQAGGQAGLAALQRAFDTYRSDAEQRIAQLNEQVTVLSSEKTQLEERLAALAEQTGGAKP